MNQLSLNLTEAKAAGQRGMRLAGEKAERLDDTFPARAEAFIYQYAREQFEFTGEQVSAAAEREGIVPLNGGRAWGTPIKRALAARVMEPTDRTAPRLKGHGAPVVVYRSMVFGGGR